SASTIGHGLRLPPENRWPHHPPVTKSVHKTALRMRFGVDIIGRSEGQALLPPEPGLRRSPELPDRMSGGGIMTALTSTHCRRAPARAANPLRSAGGVRRTDGDHAAHED